MISEGSPERGEDEFVALIRRLMADAKAKMLNPVDDAAAEEYFERERRKVLRDFENLKNGKGWHPE